MLPIYCVIGARKGVGKTRVVASIVYELKKSGFKVATVKHVAKETIDVKGKDTWIHGEAGALATVALGSREMVLIRRGVEPSLEKAVEELAPYATIIIAEGFKEAKHPKILVAQLKEDLNIKIHLEPIIAIVAPKTMKQEALNKYPSAAFFDIDGPLTNLASMIESDSITKIESKLPKKNCGLCGHPSCLDLAKESLKEVGGIDKCPYIHDVAELTVNGRRITLNPFVQQIMAKAVVGMASTLKEVPKEFKMIFLRIRFKPQSSNNQLSMRN